MGKQIESYWDLLEPHFELINIYDGSETFVESVVAIPRPVVLLYAAHMCQSEVVNGGFLQLFWNNTGIVAPQALEAYRTLGMPELASVLAQAIMVLGEPYPLVRDDRWDALLANSGKTENELELIFAESENFYLAFDKATDLLPFDDLNRRFWSLLKKENSGFENCATRFAQNPFLLQ